MTLPRLFEKTNIGRMELRNRIVMTAIHLAHADEDGFVTDRMIEFYAERAKGGVGLIEVGVCYTEPLGHDLPRQVAADRDELIPKLRELTTACQKHGAKMCCQIGHGGRYSHPAVTGAGGPVAPSPVPAPIFTRGITPIELTAPEIQKTIQNFGEAARRVKEAGFDAVELAGSGGVLIAQFLSPVTNQRTDKYGGDIKDRVRFFLEVIEEVRGKIGKDYPLLARICGNDMVPGSHTLKEQMVIAQEIEKAGVDCINVNVGWEEAPFPMLQMYVPRGTWVFLAQGIKNVVQVPVIGGIRINDPRLAEAILEEGQVDLVTMARPLITDPELPKKAMEGRFDDIRMCVACNERCLDMISEPYGVTCMLNVTAGREKELEFQPASRSKKIVVIGGGPAGAEAAMVAAKRGHQVALYEKKGKLGGMINLAAIPPGKSELLLIPEYHTTQLAKLGVKVHLGTEVTPELVEEENPDAVVVATGSCHCAPDIPGFDRDNVVTAEDVLLEKVEIGQNVVVIGGGPTGCETALFLAKKGATKADSAVFLANSGLLPADEAITLTRQGRNVTLIEMLPRIGTGIGSNMRFPLMQDLRHHGVKILINATVKEITNDGVVYSTEDKKEVVKADTIVNTIGYIPEDEIYRKLEGKVPEIYLIGDSKKPRRAVEAIEEGFLTGRQI